VTLDPDNRYHPSANLGASRYEFACRSIQKLCSQLPSQTVFDVGAGDGRMKELLTPTELSWHAFDLVPASPTITAWDLSAPCPMRGSRAGAVILLDVIEHLVNPGLGLRYIADVLHPGGWLIMTMPNPRWSRSRIHAMLHGNPACFTQTDLDLNGHVFTPWPHIIHRMLRDAGFYVEEYVTLDGRTRWPGPPITIRYPLRCAGAITNMLIERLDPSACGMSYGLLARLY
jgi:hypothetical protein